MNYLQKAIQATQSFEDKKITIQEWVKLLLGSQYVNVYSDEYCRRAEKLFALFVDNLIQSGIDTIDNKFVLDNIQRAKEDLEIQRKKLQEENRDFQSNLRNEARADLFSEKLIEAIKQLPVIPTYTPSYKNFYGGSTGVLVVSDLHYDSNYTLYGLNGEVVNQYNKEICKARLNRLIDMVAFDEVEFDNLLVVFNGDLIENILRMSSLIKLKDPVVDSVIELSEFLSQWIVTLAEAVDVPIKVAIVGGNHSVMRPLGSKPIDERENLEKIIQKFIELRLKDQPNIKVEPYTDAYFTTLHQNNILFVHGEDSDLANTMEYYENYLDISLDYIVAGHYHRGEVKTVGVGNLADKEIIRVPSICGTDSYAKKLRKHARAGATFITFTDGGRGWSKNYCLN